MMEFSLGLSNALLLFAWFAAFVSAGVLTGQKSGRTWLGWIVGIAVAIGGYAIIHPTLRLHDQVMCSRDRNSETCDNL